MENEKTEELLEISDEVLEESIETEEDVLPDLTETGEDELPDSDDPSSVSAENNLPDDSIMEEEILEQLIITNEKLDIVIEHQEQECMTIWEKPLSDYTVLEGIGLITLFIIIGVVIFKLIGGIIRCSTS